MNIQGNSAIVTGGASGLGAATAKTLVERGASVAIFDLDETKGEEYAQSIGALFVKVDVTDEKSFLEGLMYAKDIQGTARILVNCAGVISSGRILGFSGPHSLDDFCKVVRINLIGSFNAIRLASYEMQNLAPLDDGERGICINTGSVSAYEGQIGQTAYSASKAGVVGMTLTIARELSDVGIRCNTIAPGIFDTPMVDAMPSALRESLLLNVPFPKRLGIGSEFAHMVCSICENKMLNGETIRLDGGVRFQAR